MPTSIVSLDRTQYVRINTGYNPLLLQAHRDSVRIVVSELQPVVANAAFHVLSGGDAPLHLNSIDTNVWVLAVSDDSNLIVTETVNIASDFYVEVKKGNVLGHRVIHKFGSGSVGTTPVPVTASGVWKTPTSAVSLEILSSSTDDDVGGIGATKITIYGIDDDFLETVEEVELNGTTAVPLTIDILRLHRWYVSESGSYADETTSSHLGTLTIREAGAGTTWDIIPGDSPFPAQSEIGVLTIPAGHAGYILSKNIFTDTTKQANVYFMQRPFADDIVAPYLGVRRIIERDIGVSGQYSINYKVPKGPFVGPCDIGFMAEVTVGTADVSVEYEMLLVEDGF